MSDILIAKQILDYSFHINGDLSNINVEVKTNSRNLCKTDGDKTSGGIEARVDIVANNPEDLSISIKEKMFFKFENEPEDFDSHMVELFQTEGQRILYSDLDEILKALGHNPLNLLEHNK